MSILQPIVSAVRSAALKLSMVDGKPGLTKDDFMKIVEWTASIDSASKTGAQKATEVTDAVIEAFGLKLSDKWAWVPYVLTWAAHFVAKRLGKIK